MTLAAHPLLITTFILPRPNNLSSDMDILPDTKPNSGEPSEDKPVDQRMEIRMERAIRSSGLLAFISPEELQTLIALLTFVDESGRCELSSRALGQSLNLSEKQAQKRLKKLCMVRWHGRAIVMKENGRERGRFTPTGYQVMEVGGLRVVHLARDGASEGAHNTGVTGEDGSGDGGADSERGEQEPEAAPLKDGAGESGKGGPGSDASAGNAVGDDIDNTDDTAGDGCVAAIYKEDTTGTTGGDRGVVDGGVGDRDCGKHVGNAGNHDEKERILNRLLEIGVTQSTANDMLRAYSMGRIARQIEMLRYRNAKEPAAMLVKAIREDWAAPSAYMARKREEAERRAKMQAEAKEADERRIWQQQVEAARSRLSPDQLRRITEAAREKVSRQTGGVFRGKVPEVLVRSEVNRMIINQYTDRGTRT